MEPVIDRHVLHRCAQAGHRLPEPRRLDVEDDRPQDLALGVVPARLIAVVRVDRLEAGQVAAMGSRVAWQPKQ